MNLLLALLLLGAGPDRGPRVVDIRDFGATTTSAGPLNRAAFHAAIASLADAATRDGNPYGVVYVPSGSFAVDRPVFVDRPWITIRGEGEGSAIVGLKGSGHDILVYGVKRDIGTPIGPAHFPDAWIAGPGGTPILDASAVTGPGQRWCLRTMADSHLAQQGGALDVGAGDGYRSPSALTIEWKMDIGRAVASRATFATQSSLFGMTEGGHPRPFSVAFVNGWVGMWLRTVAPGDPIDGGTDRYVAVCPVDPAMSVVALSVQIDLAAGTVSAWRDGVQIRPDLGAIGAGWASGAGMKFAPNERHPFGLGSNSYIASGIADTWGGAVDVTFAGLNIAGAPVYRVGEIGAPQQRLDGRPVTDLLRYFTLTPQTIAYLPLTDTPASVQADRVVTVQGRGNGATTTGYWLSNAGHGSPYASVPAGRLESITITTGNRAYGRSVATGWTGGLVVRDCFLNGGAHGIGSLNMGANYPLTIEHCQIAAMDSAISLFYAAYCKIDDITIRTPTRCGMRFSHMEPTITNVRGLYPSSEYLIQSTDGGFRATDCYWDDEGPGAASKAAFYASAGGDNPMGSRVVLLDCSAGNTMPGRPLVVLGDSGHPGIDVSHPRGLFDCRRLLIYGTPSPVVLAGDRWSGTISPDTDGPTEWVRFSGTAGKVKAVGTTSATAP